MAINPLLAVGIKTADPVGSFQQGFAGTQKLRAGEETIKGQEIKNVSAEQKQQLETAVFKGLELEKVLSQPDLETAQAQGLESINRDIAEAESQGRQAEGLKLIRDKLQAGDVAGSIADIKADREQAQAFGIGVEGLTAATAAGGGATGGLIDRLKAADPNLNDVQALALIKGLAGQGITFSEGGRAIEQAGVGAAKGELAGAEAKGKKVGELAGRVAGGEAAIEAGIVTATSEARRVANLKAALPKAQSGVERRNTQLDRTVASIDKALPQINDFTAGIFGAAISSLSQKSKDLRANLDSVKANIGFKELEDLKAAGGTLGALSENELAMLQALLTNLEQSQSPEQLKENLNDLKDSLKASRRRVKNAFEREFKGIEGAETKQTTQPETIDFTSLPE